MHFTNNRFVTMSPEVDIFELSKKKQALALCFKITLGFSLLPLMFSPIYIYYTLIYPFLIYGIVIWRNTYLTNIKPPFILQKRSIRIITFSKFDDHSSPLFKQNSILKLIDLATFHVSLFMFKFHNKLLPAVFDNCFISASKEHNYNTRLFSQLTYSLPRVRTNYGKLIYNSLGIKVWNSLSSDLKLLSIGSFKARLKSNLISKYQHGR